jgi:hypothetical protein
MKKRFTVSGSKEVMANLERNTREKWKETVDAFITECEGIMSESQERCPVLTGTLRRSGTVQTNTENINEVEVELGYNTEYAIYVHENLEARHPVGEAKFLENPVNEHAKTIASDICKRVK